MPGSSGWRSHPWSWTPPAAPARNATAAPARISPLQPGAKDPSLHNQFAPPLADRPSQSVGKQYTYMDNKDYLLAK